MALATADSRLVRLVSGRFYYGWVIVGATFLAQMLSSMSLQGLATYVVPLEREFGWSRAAIAGGRSFQQADVFLGPLTGWLVDRFGPRRMMTMGVGLFSLSFVLFSLTDNLWSYYASMLFMAFANSLVGLLVVGVTINRWFRRRRSTAMGIAVLGLAVAGTIFIPVIVWAQGAYGWRTAAQWTAVAMLVIGYPIALLVRDAPERYGLHPDGDTDEQAATAARTGGAGGGHIEFAFGQAVRTRAFWLVTAGFALSMTAQSPLLVHQFAHMETLIDRETAALVLATSNAFNMGGRVIGGVLGDRVRKHMLLGVDLVIASMGLVLLSFARSLPVLLLYAALFGLTWGVRTPVLTSLFGDYFGRGSYGRITGVSQTIASPFAIMSPILVGIMADVQGTYVTAFLGLAVVAGAAAIAFFMAARPPQPKGKLSLGAAADNA